ncbi:rod shape-determining protein MreC [Helicobacter sp. 10-6591]|uniref:rod shape-determining protein MreC n=1 Tax=Helicobacter sp. 10-6591 TaxID=2004998 RepID=UPI000DCCA964|nr:rod shape-determining protein MreC [Helicobacter sp. 10-6591]RAX56064.1 rod shape-determining protein MreC [Helicobacter sp. 10-6591]
MRYKMLIFWVLFFVIVIVSMELSKGFENKILALGDRVRIFFIVNTQGISDWYERHFEQAKMIETLKHKVTDYDRVVLQNIALQNSNAELNAILATQNFPSTPQIYLSYMTSYVRMGEYDRVWLSLDTQTQQNLKESKLYGLVRNGIALGIARYRNGRLQGFFNGAPECSYGVFIGANKALGILDGTSKTKNNQYANVNYIPKWVDIKIGDEVYTNGLDGIFIANIAVGKVVNIYESHNYLQADIQTYAHNQESGYMWVINSGFENADFAD